MCQRALNERPRSFLRGRRRGRGSPRRPRPAAGARDVIIPSFDGAADQRELLPGAGPRARPEGADDPRDPRMGRRARQGREQLHAGALRPGRPGAAAQGRLQRAHVGLARLRRVGRHGRGRLQGLRGPRRVGAAGLARHAARAAARRCRRSARRHDGRVVRGRDRARVGRHRPPHRRHRAVDRLALAAHRPLSRRPRQGRLGCGALRARHSHGDRARGSSARRASRRGPSIRTSPPR